MINHVRTLLLNRNGDARAPDGVGEEYVPTDFRRRTLPGALLSFHHTLFGAAPDRLFLNYRLRQLTTLLHATELVDYVTLTDSRITYEPTSPVDLFAAAFKLTVSTSGISGETFVNGVAAADEAAGICRLQWQLKLQGESVLVRRMQPRHPSQFSVDYTMAGDLSTPISLVGSNLRFRFRYTPVSTTWYVDVASRPATDLGIILLRCQGLVRSDESLFFRHAPQTLRNVWETHPLAAYRYAAMLLAFTYAVDVQPQELAPQAVADSTVPPPATDGNDIGVTRILTLWPPFSLI